MYTQNCQLVYNRLKFVICLRHHLQNVTETQYMYVQTHVPRHMIAWLCPSSMHVIGTDTQLVCICTSILLYPCSNLQPSTPVPPNHPKPEYKFVDLPYTEWISQRWMYDAEAPFSDWPSLPPTIKTIQQVTSGSLSYRNGVWLLTDSELVFMDNVKSHDPSRIEFYNVTEELDIEVQLGSRVVMMDGGRLFLVTLKTIYLLDCSQPSDENS